jgi:hypothetical protein
MTAATASKAKGLVTPGGYTIPDGPAPPADVLDFLVGIQANESGFDYFRDQGSPGGSVGTYQGGPEEGFGAYQFTGPESSQVQAAEAAHWAPEAQDEIATGMVEGYWQEFGGASNPNVMADVTEAWYGPGTVYPYSTSSQSNDVLSNPSAPSGADWGNVRNALEGHPALPNAWVYGTYKGLTAAQVGAELKTGTPTTAVLTDVAPGGPYDPLNWPGEALGAVGSAAGSAVGSAVVGPILDFALKLGLTLGFAALVVVGLRETTGHTGGPVFQLGAPFTPPPAGGGQPEPTGESAAPAAASEVAPLAAAA